MKKFFILSLLLCIWSPLTFAESYPDSRWNYTDVGVIKKIKVSAETLELESTIVNDDEDCRNNSTFMLDIRNGENRHIYTAIIAAKAAKQLVYFHLGWCSPNANYYARIAEVLVVD